MSYCNRLYIIAVRGCVAAFLVLPLGTTAECLAQDNPANVENYSQRQPSGPGQDGVLKKERKLPDVVFITPVIIPEQNRPDPGPYQPNCNQPKNADDGNFCQQRRSAKAAEDAARAGEDAARIAAEQLFLAYFGLAGVALTVLLTGWTALAASRAAISSAKSANAAQKSADVSEDAFRRLERPYMFVRFDNMSTHMLRVEYVPRGVAYLTFKLVNSGKMPAILRSIAVELEPNPELPLRIPLHENSNLYDIVQPGAETANFSPVYVKGGEVGKPWLGDDATKLVFHGRYTYEDPTGALHVDRFCMRGTKNAVSFVIEGGSEYNWRKTEYPKEHRAGTRR
jgi:hypothetical protein